MDFVRDGLTAEEQNVPDWADSRLFSNPAFLESKWGADNWPSEMKTASIRAIPLLMMEIDIQNRSNGQHVITWGMDSLDQVLDGLGIYPGMCTHCYGKSGYGTVDGIGDNYVPVIRSQEHVHREMLKTFAYLAKADGEGILVRSLIENTLDDFELLYKRRLDKYPGTIGVGSFAYENVSFMSQIKLPDGTVVSLPTMAFEAVADAKTETGALENIFDYMRKKLTHFTGDLDDFANIYRPYTVTPYSPELGWVLHTGEAGSPSSSAVATGLSRAVGLPAEQFKSAKKKWNVGYIVADGFGHHNDGNIFLGREIETVDLCVLLHRTLEQVENREYDLDCDK